MEVGMYDKIEDLEGNIIQHGKYNDRIYLMSLKLREPGKVTEFIEKLDKLANKNKYSKIFAKVPQKTVAAFEMRGYRKAAFIKGSYNGKEDVWFMEKFFTPLRRKEKYPQKVKEIIATAKRKEQIEEHQIPKIIKGYDFRIALPEDSEAISEVYQKVFETYPFPIHDPNYIRQTMQENYQYLTIWDKNKLVALQSNELYPEYRNFEMTDLAILPQYRKKGFPVFLGIESEKELKKEGYVTSFVIARTLSYGSNIAVAKMGYTYTGTLVNNTNISGGLESMNIWYKTL
jgi:putative beta-lysine N-acetyltransferase